MANLRIYRIAAAAALWCAAAAGADSLVYVGTYTRDGSRGIYGFRLQPKTGKLQPLGLMAKASNPSFLVVHPDKRFLYAVNEDADGMVSSFLIDPKSGKLTPVNQVSSKGNGPCHLALDRGGRYLAVANYGSGSVAVLPLRKDGGFEEASAFVQHEGSSVNPQRQKGPHAHAVVFSPDNRFLLAADLGADKIFIYRVDEAGGTLTAAAAPFVAVAPGAGVRHLAFHPNGRVLYSIDELASTVSAFWYNAETGALQEFQTVATLSPNYSGPSTAAEIVVNAAGTMVYGSNRGLDSLALLRIDPVRFTLKALEFTPLLGKTPRHFALDPAGAYMVVANQDSNSLSVFKVHPRTGQIQPAGRPVSVGLPSCVVFVPE